MPSPCLPVIADDTDLVLYTTDGDVAATTAAAVSQFLSSSVSPIYASDAKAAWMTSLSREPCLQQAVLHRLGPAASSSTSSVPSSSAAAAATTATAAAAVASAAAATATLSSTTSTGHTHPASGVPAPRTSAGVTNVGSDGGSHPAVPVYDVARVDGPSSRIASTAAHASSIAAATVAALTGVAAPVPQTVCSLPVVEPGMLGDVMKRALPVLIAGVFSNIAAVGQRGQSGSGVDGLTAARSGLLTVQRTR